MNIYCIINNFGNIQLVYGDYFKARKYSTCGVRLVNCDPDDVRFGRVSFNDLPKL